MISVKKLAELPWVRVNYADNLFSFSMITISGFLNENLEPETLTDPLLVAALISLFGVRCEKKDIKK